MRSLYGFGLAAAALMLVVTTVAWEHATESDDGSAASEERRAATPRSAVFGLPRIDPAALTSAARGVSTPDSPANGVDIPRYFPREGMTRAQQYAVPDGYAFYFTRAMYTGRGGGGWGWGRRGRGAWATDFDDAEYFFTALLSRLIDIDVFEGPNPMELDDPEIRRFPFLYFVEPGQMSMTQSEVEGLRSYLEAGGFIMLDDFWGTRETYVVEDQMRRVLPDRQIVDIPLDHPIFHAVYDIEEIRQVPNVTRGRNGGRTDEGDNSEIPSVRGIFDDHGRLMVIINQNTDLGDAWEWGEDPYYPLDYSTYATEVGINTVVYAMSH